MRVTKWMLRWSGVFWYSMLLLRTKWRKTDWDILAKFALHFNYQMVIIAIDLPIFLNNRIWVLNLIAHRYLSQIECYNTIVMDPPFIELQSLYFVFNLLNIKSWDYKVCHYSTNLAFTLSLIFTRMISLANSKRQDISYWIALVAHPANKNGLNDIWCNQTATKKKLLVTLPQLLIFVTTSWYMPMIMSILAKDTLLYQCPP